MGFLDGTLELRHCSSFFTIHPMVFTQGWEWWWLKDGMGRSGGGGVRQRGASKVVSEGGEGFKVEGGRGASRLKGAGASKVEGGGLQKGTC